jgi:hypothetical protein
MNPGIAASTTPKAPPGNRRLMLLLSTTLPQGLGAQATEISSSALRSAARKPPAGRICSCDRFNAALKRRSSTGCLHGAYGPGAQLPLFLTLTDRGCAGAPLFAGCPMFRFFSPSRNRGCPTVRGPCEGWDSTLSTPDLLFIQRLSISSPPTRQSARDCSSALLPLCGIRASLRQSGGRAALQGRDKECEGINTSLPQAFGAERQEFFKCALLRCAQTFTPAGAKAAPSGDPEPPAGRNYFLIRFNAALKRRSSTRFVSD